MIDTPVNTAIFQYGSRDNDAVFGPPNDVSESPFLSEADIQLLLLNARSAFWDRKWKEMDQKWNLAYGGQWDWDEQRRIRLQGREPFSYNVIEPQVRHMYGEYLSSPSQWKLYPADEQSIHKAALAEKALNAIAKRAQYGSIVEPMAFLDGLVGGIGIVGRAVNRLDEDKEEIILERVDPKEFMFDPTNRMPDLSQARWLARRVYRTLPEALEMYPDQEDVIKAASSMREIYFDDLSDWFQTGNLITYDQRLIPLIEFYERRRVKQYVLVDPNHAEDPLIAFMSRQDAAEEHERRMGEYNVRLMGGEFGQRGLEPIYLMTESLPRIAQTVIAAVTPIFQRVLTQTEFPYSCFFPYYYSDGDFGGSFDPIMGPQKFMNRLVLSADYALQVAAKGGLAVKLDSLENVTSPQQIREEYAKTGAMIFVKDDVDDIRKVMMPLQNNQPVSPVTMQLIESTRQQINQHNPSVAYGAPVPGVNGGSPNPSGRSVALQSRIAATGEAVIQASLKLFRRSTGEGLLFDIQHYLSKPQTLQIFGKYQSFEWQTLNTSPADTIADERFVVDVTDSDYSVSAKQIRNQQLQALLQNPVIPMYLPHLMPFLAKAYFESTDLPDDLMAEAHQILENPPPPPPPPQPGDQQGSGPNVPGIPSSEGAPGARGMARPKQAATPPNPMGLPQNPTFTPSVMGPGIGVQ